MTKEDWKKVEESLDSFYDMVKLRCDGYILTLYLARYTQFKNGITVYVNGKVEGRWLVEDCEERRRFMRPVKNSVHPPKERAKLKKLSKRLQKSSPLLNPDASFLTYRSYWTSFKALKNHLIKNNTNIELLPKEVVMDYDIKT